MMTGALRASTPLSLSPVLPSPASWLRPNRASTAGGPVRDWEFFLTAAPSCLAVVLQACLCTRPSAHPASSSTGKVVAFFSLLGQGCIQLHVLSQGCGGAIYRAWQPFRRRSETPWLSSCKCGPTLAIRSRLCVFLQTLVRPVLELTLPKGELPSPCDRLPEGSPEGSPNPRAKAFLMGAISYDVPT